MLESVIIEKMKNGEIEGIALGDNYAYIPLRITGLCARERISPDGNMRKVDRREDIFATPEMMEAYANLPIVLTHPKNESGEIVRAGYENGIFVGNTIASFIKDTEGGKEVWGIGRFFDKETIKGIALDDLSTSPHFITEEFENEIDGEKIFVEVPQALNSLAIVWEGFWDATSTTPPIDNSTITLIKEDSGMSEKEVKEVEVKEEEKADESLEQQVQDLKEGEKEEGKHFEAMAKEHEEKADEGKEEDKADPCTDKADEVEVKNVENFKDWDGKPTTRVEVETKGATMEEANATLKEELKDLGIIESETYTEDDEEREKVVKEIKEIADEAPVNMPYTADKRYTGWATIRKFAKANPDLVPDKFKGFADKIDGSVRDLAMDMLKGMKEKAIKQNQDKRAKAELAQMRQTGIKIF